MVQVTDQTDDLHQHGVLDTLMINDFLKGMGTFLPAAQRKGQAKTRLGTESAEEKAAKQAMIDAQKAHEGKLAQLAGVKFNEPAKRKVSNNEMIALGLGELLKQLTSRVPASQRGGPQLIDQFQAMNEQERQRLLEAESRRVENERNTLMANVRASESALQGARNVYDFERDDVTAANRDYQREQDRFDALPLQQLQMQDAAQGLKNKQQTFAANELELADKKDKAEFDRLDRWGKKQWLKGRGLAQNDQEAALIIDADLNEKKKAASEARIAAIREKVAEGERRLFEKYGEQQRRLEIAETQSSIAARNRSNQPSAADEVGPNGKPSRSTINSWNVEIERLRRESSDLQRGTGQQDSDGKFVSPGMQRFYNEGLDKLNPQQRQKFKNIYRLWLDKQKKIVAIQKQLAIYGENPSFQMDESGVPIDPTNRPEYWDERLKQIQAWK